MNIRVNKNSECLQAVKVWVVTDVTDEPVMWMRGVSEQV